MTAKISQPPKHPQWPSINSLSELLRWFWSFTHHILGFPWISTRNLCPSKKTKSWHLPSWTCRETRRPLVLGFCCSRAPRLPTFLFDHVRMALNLASSIIQTVTKQLVPGKFAEWPLLSSLCQTNLCLVSLHYLKSRFVLLESFRYV